MRCSWWILIPALACAADYPAPLEGDWVVTDFKFTTGETLHEMRLHYTTSGEPSSPAVLILHGTGGSGRGFLSPGFGGELFGKDQPLDARRHYIILPDSIGHGKSSKPSDGLRTRFPHYTYTDMVRAQYRLLTEKLGVKHLRLVMGASMGGMHTWLWGVMYPDFMDALMPLASAPVEIAGRNRMLRRMIMDSIRNDPDWKNGEYRTPLRGMLAAQFALFLMTSSPLQLYQQAPTREKADELFDRRFYRQASPLDPNDMLYAYDCSRDYNPAPDLEKIQAPLLAINSADDQVNPPELGILEREIRRVKRGRFVLLPISPETRGHGTVGIAKLWKHYLEELLSAARTPSP